MQQALSKLRLTQRQAGHGAHLLLELVDAAGIERVVSAVVRPGRELIDVELAAVGHEHLHGQHAHILQCGGHLGGERHGLGAKPGRDARRHRRGVQNAVPVHVFGGRKGGHLAIPAASQHDGNLPLQVEFPFQDAGHPAKVPERLLGVLDAPTRACPFPSYPRRLVLSSAGTPIALMASVRSASPATRAKGAVRKPAPARKPFSAAVLGDGHGRRGGADRQPRGEPLEHRSRDVLELGRDRGALIGKLIEGGRVVVGGDDLVVGDLAGGAPGIRLEHDDAISHDARAEREHAPELPAAQHARAWRPAGSSGIRQ